MEHIACNVQTKLDCSQSSSIRGQQGLKLYETFATLSFSSRPISLPMISHGAQCFTVPAQHPTMSESERKLITKQCEEGFEGKQQHDPRPPRSSPTCSLVRDLTGTARKRE